MTAQAEMDLDDQQQALFANPVDAVGAAAPTGVTP